MLGLFFCIHNLILERLWRWMLPGVFSLEPCDPLQHFLHTLSRPAVYPFFSADSFDLGTCSGRMEVFFTPCGRDIPPTFGSIRRTFSLPLFHPVRSGFEVARRLSLFSLGASAKVSSPPPAVRLVRAPFFFFFFFQVQASPDFGAPTLKRR